MASVIENAAAAERHKTFTPLRTLSKGYDSPTVAVLAKECGSRKRSRWMRRYTVCVTPEKISAGSWGIGYDAYQHCFGKKLERHTRPEHAVFRRAGRNIKEFIATGAWATTWPITHSGINWKGVYC